MTTFISGFGRAFRPDLPFLIKQTADQKLELLDAATLMSPMAFLAQMGGPQMIVEPGTPAQLSTTRGGHEVRGQPHDSVVMVELDTPAEWRFQSAHLSSAWPAGTNLQCDMLGPRVLALTDGELEDRLLTFFPPDRLVTFDDLKDLLPSAKLVSEGKAGPHTWYEVQYDRRGEPWRHRWYQIRLDPDAVFNIRLQFPENDTTNFQKTAEALIDGLERPRPAPVFRRVFKATPPPHGTFEFEEECGPIALLTIDAFEALATEDREHLGRIGDPHARTCASEGFDEESWPQVWEESVAKLKSGWLKDHCALLAIHPDDTGFVVCFDARSPEEEADTLISIEGFTNATEVALVDLTALFEPPYEDLDWLELPAGTKRIRLSVVDSKRLESELQGLPYIFVEIEPATEARESGGLTIV